VCKIAKNAFGKIQYFIRINVSDVRLLVMDEEKRISVLSLSLL
jgi:hypothetical protein